MRSPGLTDSVLSSPVISRRRTRSTGKGFDGSSGHTPVERLSDRSNPGSQHTYKSPPQRPQGHVGPVHGGVGGPTPDPPGGVSDHVSGVDDVLRLRVPGQSPTLVELVVSLLEDDYEESRVLERVDFPVLLPKSTSVLTRLKRPE